MVLIEEILNSLDKGWIICSRKGHLIWTSINESSPTHTCYAFKMIKDVDQIFICSDNNNNEIAIYSHNNMDNMFSQYRCLKIIGNIEDFKTFRYEEKEETKSKGTCCW